jgi:uncharacterized membrane protein
VEKETYRLEAFSDGVFAIVITLLALDLKVPHVDAISSRNLARALLEEWPSYLAFVATFISVLIMWINHHGIFRTVHKTSTQLFFSNGFLLLLIITTPFITALVGTYLRTPAACIATAVYTGTFIVISVAFNWLWVAASACSQTTAHTARISRNYKLGLPIYCVATASTYVSPLLALAICMSLWVFWAFTMRDA